MLPSPLNSDDLPSAEGVVVSNDGTRRKARWALASEAPLALLYEGEQFGVMMVTPTDLEDFVVGFSLTEGIVRSVDDITDIRLTETARGYAANLKLAAGLKDSARERRRSIVAGSACGICGAETVEAAVPRPPMVRGAWPEPDAVSKALACLGDMQPQNRVNRSTHAAAFATLDGDLRIAREDIGRHNALDKLAGALARGTDADVGFVVLSSRLSVEMVMKVARMGIPFVASVSAPSDLALEKAAEAGLGVACRAGDDLMVFGEGRL